MEPSETPRKRRRPPKACEQCRRRKVRCDQKSPCNQCIRLKIDNCSYDPQTLIKRATKPLYERTLSTRTVVGPPTPSTTVDHDTSLQRREPLTFSGPSSTIQSPLNSRLDDTLHPTQRHHDGSELLENRILHVTQHDTRAPRPIDAAPFEHRGDLHGTITKTRLLGRSHWVNIIQEFPFITHMQKMLLGGQGGDVKTFLDRCKTLGRDIKNQIQADFKIHANIRDHVPSKDLADNLVDNYFEAFESYYRILHIPSFRREYEQYWKTPDSASPIFIMKLLLVLAIGTCLCSDEPFHELHNAALQWINVANSWLTSPFTEKARVSVSGIQIFCLSLIARETCSVSPDLIWISAGSLVRTAMLTGLHRDPSYFSRLTPLQTEIRRRLWATVMEICLQACMNAGGSPLITTDMHDCKSPTNLDDEDMNEDDGAVVAPKADTIFTRTSVQLALLQTFASRCQIARMLNDFRHEQTFSETLQIDTRLGSKLHQLSSRLKTSHAASTIAANDIDLKMYDLMTYRFLVSLHQTFAIKAMADPMFYFSRKVCLDTSLRLLHSAFPLPASTPDKADFQQILAVSSGTAKNVIMVAFLMISLELVTQTEERQMTPMSVSDNMLRSEIFRVLDEYNQYTLRRVKNGETNVKGYVFSTVGLAHFRHLDAGKSGDDAAVEAGVRSLGVACEILQKRLNESTPKTTFPEHDFGAGEEPSMMLGDDFGWDDWDPSSNFLATDVFLPQSGQLL